MIFSIKCLERDWPNMDHVLADKGLETYIPKSLSYTIINYGQGEGQALIGGIEWGFYYNDNDGMDIVMESDGLQIENASYVVSLICRYLSQQFQCSFTFEYIGER